MKEKLMFYLKWYKKRELIKNRKMKQNELKGNIKLRLTQLLDGLHVCHFMLDIDCKVGHKVCCCCCCCCCYCCCWNANELLGTNLRSTLTSFSTFNQRKFLVNQKTRIAGFTIAAKAWIIIEVATVSKWDLALLAQRGTSMFQSLWLTALGIACTWPRYPNGDGATLCAQYLNDYRSSLDASSLPPPLAPAVAAHPDKPLQFIYQGQYET